MVTDPIADMLTRIRNACRARHGRVDVPTSKLKVKIAEILKQEGYIQDFRVIAASSTGHSVMEVKISYDKESLPVITDIQRVSRPGLRQYMQSKEIPQIRRGLGILIMSTSQGLMTDRSARKANIGGEALCAVW
jgi:small subunit ribosomal protein S8